MHGRADHQGSRDARSPEPGGVSSMAASNDSTDWLRGARPGRGLRGPRRPGAGLRGTPPAPRSRRRRRARRWCSPRCASRNEASTTVVGLYGLAHAQYVDFQQDQPDADRRRSRRASSPARSTTRVRSTTVRRGGLGGCEPVDGGGVRTRVELSLAKAADYEVVARRGPPRGPRDAAARPPRGRAGAGSGRRPRERGRLPRSSPPCSARPAGRAAPWCGSSADGPIAERRSTSRSRIRSGWSSTCPASRARPPADRGRAASR